MVILFPTPEIRLRRRVEKLISTAHVNHRHQVTISRKQREPFDAWERLVEQFEESDDIHVIYISRQDILINWYSPTSGLAS